MLPSIQPRRSCRPRFLLMKSFRRKELFSITMSLISETPSIDFCSGFIVAEKDRLIAVMRAKVLETRPKPGLEIFLKRLLIDSDHNI